MAFCACDFCFVSVVSLFFGSEMGSIFIWFFWGIADQWIVPFSNSEAPSRWEVTLGLTSANIFSDLCANASLASRSNLALLSYHCDWHIAGSLPVRLPRYVGGSLLAEEGSPSLPNIHPTNSRWKGTHEVAPLGTTESTTQAWPDVTQGHPAHFRRRWWKEFVNDFLQLTPESLHVFHGIPRNTKVPFLIPPESFRRLAEGGN